MMKKYGLEANDFLSVLDDKLADLIIRTMDRTIHFSETNVDSYLFRSINNHYLDTLRRKQTNKAQRQQTVTLDQVPLHILKHEHQQNLAHLEAKQQQLETQLFTLQKIIAQLNPTEKAFIEGMMEGKKRVTILRELGYKEFLEKTGFSKFSIAEMSPETIQKKARDRAYYFIPKLFDKIRNAIFQEMSLNIN